jgi:hypothetical protein
MILTNLYDVYYIQFSVQFLEFLEDGLQAVIVSQNENHYQFFQFKEDGNYNISRPINGSLMHRADKIEAMRTTFLPLLKNAKAIQNSPAERIFLCHTIYTLQQSIGATLDALPSGESNTARKINGDLFERLMQLLIQHTGIDCQSGVIRVPVEVDGEEAFHMSYQHDLLLYSDPPAPEPPELKVIGSVKTSSKDRIDKIFIDKFLYNKLTGTEIPHIAIFLNDVQRKNTKRENEYGINSTFLPGHFKGYTVKLNPLDGVYYCDLRPNMGGDPFLNRHIKTIDHLFCDDLPKFLG